MAYGCIVWAAYILVTFVVLEGSPITLCEPGGYSSSRPALLSSFPDGTVRVTSRTQLECAMACVKQQKTCLQLYYNSTTDSCYIIPSAATLATTPSSSGWLLTTPNAKLENGKSCSNTNCPSGSICITDCSSAFGGAMCAADNSQCSQATDIINTNHYYTGWYEDDRDIGVVHTVTFNKTINTTALRVFWYATTRGQYNPIGSCGRYYVTFNGSECKNPTTIDFSNYDVNPTNHQRFSELEGMCFGLPAGVVTVAILVGPCPGTGLSDSYTGWHTGRSMWIYEVNTAASSAYAQCLALPLFNTLYYSVSTPASHDSSDSQIQVTSYTKIASDTVLRVKWLGTARIQVLSNTHYCGRWYIRVNGTECNPRAEFILGMLNNSFNAAQDNHRTRTLEGFCYGLPAGTYSVELRVGECRYPTAQPNTMTRCCGSASRMTIREIRMGTTTQAVAKADGSMFKLPFFNIQHWWWYALNNDIDQGNIQTVDYTKLSDTSGLHLRMVGEARVFSNSGCCRWYFTINSAECANPGAIEGVILIDKAVNYHSPGVIDGVCYGLASGTYSIGYNVGICNGYDVHDCFTGYESTLHIIVGEVQPESRVTCANPFSCP